MFLQRSLVANCRVKVPNAETSSLREKKNLNGAADRSRFIYRKVPLQWRDSSHTLQAAFSSDMTDTERKT